MLVHRRDTRTGYVGRLPVDQIPESVWLVVQRKVFLAHNKINVYADFIHIHISANGVYSCVCILVCVCTVCNRPQIAQYVERPVQEP